MGAFVLRSPRILYKGGVSKVIGVREPSVAAIVQNASDAI
jgi:hypothetical protein